MPDSCVYSWGRFAQLIELCPYLSPSSTVVNKTVVVLTEVWHWLYAGFARMYPASAQSKKGSLELLAERLYPLSTGPTNSKYLNKGLVI